MALPSPYVLIAFVAASCDSPAPLPAAEVVRAAFIEVHPRVYQVYDVPMERDAVWELLDRTFAGEALTQQYVEHWTTRVRMNAEETSIRVAKVDHDEVEVIAIEPGLAKVEAAWSVGGVVTHGDHKHPRVNRYRAVYTLSDNADGWRIISTRMRDVTRVRSPSRIQGVFDILDEEPDDGGGYMDPLDLLDAGLSGDPDDSDKAGP